MRKHVHLTLQRVRGNLFSWSFFVPSVMFTLGSLICSCRRHGYEENSKRNTGEHTRGQKMHSERDWLGPWRVKRQCVTFCQTQKLFFHQTLQRTLAWLTIQIVMLMFSSDLESLWRSRFCMLLVRLKELPSVSKTRHLFAQAEFQNV